MKKLMLVCCIAVAYSSVLFGQTATPQPVKPIKAEEKPAPKPQHDRGLHKGDERGMHKGDERGKHKGEHKGEHRGEHKGEHRDDRPKK